MYIYIYIYIYIKFNTGLFCIYNHERIYYYCPHNNISAYTKYHFLCYLYRRLAFVLIFPKNCACAHTWQAEQKQTERKTRGK